MNYLDYLTTYPEMYQGFSRVINRTENLSNYFYEHSLIPTGASIFSLGCGEGELELKLAQDKQCSLELLEPAKLFVTAFYKALEKSKPSIKSANMHLMPFEDFNVSTQFDVVLSIHSWYGLGFDEGIMKKALSLVKPGGRLVINIMSRKSPVHGLSQFSHSGGIDLCAETLSEWATELGCQHTFDLEHARRPTDVFFEKDGSASQGAQDFISFLSAIPWADMTNDEQTERFDIIKANHKDGVVDIVSGNLVFEVENAQMQTKPSSLTRGSIH